jgi:hypothetical protein
MHRHRVKLFTVVPIEVLLKYWFNTLPRADLIKFLEIFIHFLWKSQFQVFDHFWSLPFYLWLVSCTKSQTTKVIGAFKLFNRKFTIILELYSELSLVQIYKFTLNIHQICTQWLGGNHSTAPGANVKQIYKFGIHLHIGIFVFSSLVPGKKLLTVMAYCSCSL